MEASNLELYTLVLHDAPFVIAAYAILWAALMVYISMVLRRLMRIEKEITVLEESIERRSASQ
ncbi:MAG: CcmD family protein [Actinobacteria bacterium]|nr:CcmD family protein [Actinomycetota bacterium]MCL5886875.1 CcmD family protein [Actinomycetota bacterium]